MREIAGFACLLALASSLNAIDASAQGIDCSKARTPNERAICASPALIALDREVGSAYAASVARQPERRDELLQSQLAWLRSRDAACARPGVPRPACLQEQLTARLGALAGPVPPQATAQASQIDPAPARVPDPAIPATPLPQSAASLDRTDLPAAELAETLLHVTSPGRFILAVKSASGAALQLVDMLTGPSDPAGAAGSQDGRLDPLLDVGTYKLRVMAAKGATGELALSVTPFHDAAPPAALPQPGQPLSVTLTDGEQRRFWLMVPPSGAVRIEAAGRALADLRLWRDGRVLSELQPAIAPIEPVPGHGLTDARLEGKVEPGTYLVVAYGGPATTWTDGDTAQPLDVRAGASDALEAGWAGGVIGPFGSEVFAVPANAARLRLSLPEPAAAELGTGRATASIARDSREPVARLAVEPGREATVTVRAAAGQRYTLRALERLGQTVDKPGTYWVSALAEGAGGDEVPPTVLLERADRSGKPPRIVADTLPTLDANGGWHASFNLRGPTTLLARSTGGPVALRTMGVPVRGGRLNADLPEGVYGLTLAPQEGARGAVEFILGPPGATPSLSAALPPDPALPLGIQMVAPGEQLRLRGGAAPGLTLGLSARPVPVALAEGALAVTLNSGAGLTVPVRLATGGVLSVTELGAGPVPYISTPTSDGVTVGLPPSDRARTVVLSWRRDRAAPAAIPAPAAPDRGPAMQAGTPVFFDLAADAPRSFGLTVPQGGLFRIETLGRLHTTGRLSTAFIPSLASSEADGVGENMLIQRVLRAGAYQVEVSASDSAGRAGLLATPAPLLQAAALRPGGSVRASLPAGSGATVPVVVEAAQILHLDVFSLGAAWRGRLEDEEGWPLTPPGELDGIERAMAPGRYRIVLEPAAVARQVVLRLRSIEPPSPIEGHGPHPLPFAQRQTATWREPDSASAPRTPDRWTFALEGPAEVKLNLSDTMVGQLSRTGASDTPRRIVRSFTGALEAGQYQLDVTSLGRNDRADYAVTLNSTALQPGVPRSVALPAKLPFALATSRVVSLTSFGTTPVKAVLRDASGRLVARSGPRRDDWNIALSRPLPAGSYALELLAASAPDTTDTARRDAPAASDADTPDDSDAAAVPSDDQAAQTVASQASDPVPAKPSRPGTDDTADDAPGPQVEVRLALPPALDLVPAPATAGLLAGNGIHVLSLERPTPGSLVIAQAQSAAALTLTLERQDASGWSVVASDEGLSPVVASPVDDDPRPWRVQVWTVDGGPDTVTLAARTVVAAAQEPGRVTLAPLEGMAAPLAIARVAIPPGLAKVGVGLLAGSWPGLGLQQVEPGTVQAQDHDLWLLGPAGVADAAALVPTPGEAVALTVPEGMAVTLPSGTDTQLWQARNGASLGAATGWAEGSVIASAGGLVSLRATGADTRLSLVRHTLVVAPAQAVDTALHTVLPAGGALPLTLPAVQKRVQLDLSAGTGAITAGGGALWSGDAAATRAVSGSWTELLLVNPGPTPAPVSVSVSPDEPNTLAPGQVLKRFYGAAGAFEVAAAGVPGARLHLAGPGRMAVIAADGRIVTGRDIAMDQPARVLVQHPAGAVAVWMETPDASPWPAVNARPVQAPFRLSLSGDAAALSLHGDTPVLLHATTTAPVLAGLVQAGRTDAPTLFPAGAELHRMLAPGDAELRLYPAQDGPLTGTLSLRAEPILPITEGLGAAVTVPPGGAAAFGFTLQQQAKIGVGVRAEPDRASARLLDATGRVVGEGVAQLLTLKPGRYVLEAQVPPDAPTTVLRPAVVGITPRGNGPPPDVVQSYLELAGMKPQGVAR